VVFQLNFKVQITGTAVGVGVALAAQANPLPWRNSRRDVYLEHAIPAHPQATLAPLKSFWNADLDGGLSIVTGVASGSRKSAAAVCGLAAHPAQQLIDEVLKIIKLAEIDATPPKSAPPKVLAEGAAAVGVGIAAGAKPALLIVLAKLVVLPALAGIRENFVASLMSLNFSSAALSLGLTSG
jgi:hypothetical protein